MTAMCHLPFTRGKPSGILPTFFFFFDAGFYTQGLTLAGLASNLYPPDFCLLRLQEWATGAGLSSFWTGFPWTRIFGLWNSRCVPLCLACSQHFYTLSVFCFFLGCFCDSFMSTFFFCRVGVKWDWGLNSGLCTCKAGIVQLKWHLQSILSWLFWR
jgi:hypothetical protein